MKLFAPCVLFAALAALAGCQSSIRPLEPLREVEYDEPAPATATSTSAPATSTAPGANPTASTRSWNRDGRAGPKNGPQVGFTDPHAEFDRSAPATTAKSADLSNSSYGTLGAWAIAEANATSTAPATATAPTTQAKIRKTRMVDPNQVVRYAYRTNYDEIWQHSLQLLSDMGYTVDRQDYRLGVIITKPNPSPHVVEPWKPDQTSFNAALENSINTQRRTIRVTISRAPNPAFYEVGVQVLVERQSNPSENIAGPIGPVAGRSISQGTDYTVEPGEEKRWRTLGHDPELERKVIDKLFKSL